MNIFDLVCEDIRKREAKGLETYGGPLDPMDGRDWLQEAYDEHIDQAVYLRAEIEKRMMVWESLSGETS